MFRCSFLETGVSFLFGFHTNFPLGVGSILPKRHLSLKYMLPGGLLFLTWGGIELTVTTDASLCPLGMWEVVCVCVFAKVGATVVAPGSSEAWTSEWAVGCCRWQVLRLDIMKQKIKILHCQNFQGQCCCSLSFQVRLAQDLVWAALCAFLDRRKVPELIKPISGRVHRFPEEIEMSGLACFQASGLNSRHGK